MLCSSLLLALLLAVFVKVNGQTYNWELVWSDEFDGTSINTDNWQVEVGCWGGGNREAECYVNNPDNIYIDNGVLNIKPIYIPGGYQGSAADCTYDTQDSCTWTQPCTSGKIQSSTSKTAHWTYGKFEFSAKLPKGNFLWPAIWMMPEYSVYGGWPASGEIDIMEWKGQEVNTTYQTIHYGGVYPCQDATGNTYTSTYDLTEAFHNYTLIWTPDTLSWYLDEVQTFTTTLDKSFFDTGCASDPYNATRQPFDQSFFIIINLAISGSFFPSSQFGTFNASVASTSWTQNYMIDYVRVYQNLTTSPTNAPPSSSEMPTSSKSAATSFFVVDWFLLAVIFTIMQVTFVFL